MEVGLLDAVGGPWTVVQMELQRKQQHASEALPADVDDEAAMHPGAQTGPDSRRRLALRWA